MTSVDGSHITKRKLLRLYGLKPAQIRAIMRDLNFVHKGYRIIVAVDSHELFDYCFPINPTEGRRQTDPEELAESQAALSHLFQALKVDRFPVVLLPEYQEELETVLATIAKESPRVHDLAEVIESMVEAGDLDEVSKEKRRELDEVVKRSFQFLLTVLLGIHSTGVNRMREAMGKVLKSVSQAIHPRDQVFFEEIWKKYKRTPNYGTILRVLEKHSRTNDPKTRKKNERDASAIDRLIYLNSAAENAYRGRLLKHGYIFLYLSSAAKSKDVFDRKEVKKILPRIMKRRYSFLRTRQQILVYVIHRDHTGQTMKERALAVFREMMPLHALLSKLEELRGILPSPANDCKECILDGKQPKDCQRENACQEIADHANKIDQKKKESINWGLYNQIDSYRFLLEARVPDLDYGIYIQLFKELIESPAMSDLALERMHETQAWLTRESDWMILRHPGGSHNSNEYDMRTDDDPVRGVDQYLPTQPRFKSTAYKEVVDLILEFFRNPSREELVEQTYVKFHELDPKTVRRDEEYNLLLSYIYLTFGREGKTVHADIKKKLLPGKDSANHEVWRESLYVLCWSARRFGLFAESEDYAGEGIAKFPYDPRFHHGWALTVFSAHVREAECPFSMTQAVEASARALDLYLRDGNTNQVAASYNNIAYMLAYAAKHSQSDDREELSLKLTRARESLERLKTVMDESHWSPQHPEFYHTEAFLEHFEVINSWFKQDLLPDELAKKLWSAKENIQKALDIYDCDRYQKLKREIVDFYEKVLRNPNR